MPKSDRTELNRLLARALDQRLEPDEVVRLEQLLTDNPEAREEYVQLTILQSFIQQEHQSESIEDQIQRSLNETMEDAILSEACCTEKPRPAGSVSKRMRTRRRSLSIAAVVTVVACLAWFAVSRSGLLSPSSDILDPQNPTDLYAAKVIDVDKCRWMLPRMEFRKGDILYPKQTLQLSEGVAQFRFRSGTEIVIEGPAEFTLLDGNSMLLYSGRLMAHVFDGGIGFTVHTPDAEVVDLGTRFGMSVDADGATEAHVFEGEIEMSSHGEMIETLAGLAVSVEDGRLELKEAAPDDFANLAVNGPIEIVDPVYNHAEPAKPTPVHWGPAQDLTGPCDIMNEGTIVQATNCGQGYSTINGVAFKYGRPFEGRGNTDLNGYSTGDADFDKLIASYCYDKSPCLMGVEGLEVGQQYKIQLILADPRSLRDGDRITYGDRCQPESKVTLRNHAMTSGEPPYGQYVIGTFTANSPTLQLTAFPEETDRNVAFISGFVLQKIDDESP